MEYVVNTAREAGAIASVANESVERLGLPKSPVSAQAAVGVDGGVLFEIAQRLLKRTLGLAW